MPGLDDIKTLLSNIISPVKAVYFGLEDKWYELLDKIDQKYPVNAIVDKVDKVVPSFAVFLIIILLLFTGLLSGLGGLAGIFAGNYSVTFTVTSSSGDSLSDIELIAEQNGKTTSLFSDDSGLATGIFSSGKLTLTVADPSYQEYYQEFQITKSENYDVILSLLQLEKSRLLLIQDDSGNIISSSSILIKFSCSSGSAPADILTYSGQVNIIQPAECDQLFASISVDGFKQKSAVIDSDRVVVVLERTAAALDSDRGKIAVSVTDSAGSPIDLVDLKLYKLISATNTPALSDNIFSDSSGSALFEDLLPGNYYVTAKKDGFNIQNSDTVVLTSGVTETLSISLSSAASEKLFFAKFLNASGQPIKDVTVRLYIDANSAPGITVRQLLAELSTDDNGLASTSTGSISSSVGMIASHPQYVTIIQESTTLLPKGSSSPTQIGMEDAKRDAKGIPINFSEVVLQVLDNTKSPVQNALTSLYWKDVNGLVIDELASDRNGSALYSNLPVSSYQGIAQKNGFFGLSSTGISQIGKKLSLPITLQAGSSRIDVSVFDSAFTSISGASIDFVDFSTGEVLASGVTDSSGFLGQSLDANHTVFIRASKSGFYTTTTEALSLIQDNIQRKSVILYSQSGNNTLSMQLQSILELSGIPASTILPGKNYLFQYSVLVPSSQLGVKTHHRVGKESELSSDDTLAVIDSASSSVAISSFSKTWDSRDDFKLPVPVSNAAKMSVLDFKDLNSPGAHSYTLNTGIKGTAVVGEVLETRFRAKTTVLNSPTYFQSFILGDPIVSQQGDYTYKFVIQPVGSSQSYQLDEFTTLNLAEDTVYDLLIDVTNNSDQNYTAASLDFSSTLSSFQVSPSTLTIGKFLTGQTFATKITVTPTALTSFAQLKVELKNVSGSPTKKFLSFQVIPENVLNVSISPSALLANSINPVTIVVSDSLTGEVLGSADGSVVKLTYFAPDGSQVGQDFLTDDSFEIFSKSVSPLADGSKVLVEVTNPRFSAFTQTLQVTESGGIDFAAEEYSCVTVSPQLLSDIPQGFSKSFTISASSCSEDVYVTLQGFAGDEALSTSPVMGTEFLLGKTANRTITVFADKHLGVYPIFVRARYKTSTLPSPIAEVEAIAVDPSLSKCFDLQKYSYNIVNGVDAGSVVNDCFIDVSDPAYPKLSLDTSHALALSGLSPPTGPASFDWSVKADILDLSSGNTTKYHVAGPFTASIPIVQFNLDYLLGVPKAEIESFLSSYYDSNSEDNNASQLITFYVENSSSGTFLTTLIGFEVYGRYILDVQSNNGLIDFNMLNVNLRGEEYSLLQIEDYVGGQSDYQTITFDYNVYLSGTGGVIIADQVASIPADGLPHKIGKLDLPAGTYVITDSNALVSTFFTPPGGTTTSDPKADIEAVSTQVLLTVPEKVDIAFNIDTSGSMDDEWRTICSNIDAIISDLEVRGIDVTYTIYGMDRARACSSKVSVWGSNFPKLSRDEGREIWAPSSTFIAKNRSWQDGAKRMIIIIGDTAPTGNNEGFGYCSWRYEFNDAACGDVSAGVPSSLDFVEELIQEAKARDITLYSLVSPVRELDIFSDLTVSPFDPLKSDTVELFDYAAKKTGGFMAIYGGNFSAGGGNNLVSLIMQAIIPKKQEFFHVKLEAGSNNLCLRSDGTQGVTGTDDYLPQINLNWSWDSNVNDGKAQCDLTNLKAVYCDSTQFSIAVLEKLELIKKAYETRQTGDLPSLISFDVLLQKDGYTDDFQKDFADYYSLSNQNLPIDQLPPSFFSNSTNFEAWESYMRDTSRLVFTSPTSPLDDRRKGVSPLPSSGIYRVNISIDWQAGTGTFFISSQPSAIVYVSLQKLSNALNDNPLYNLPFDGMVGMNYSTGNLERNGYGVDYAGSVLTLVDEGSTLIETAKSNSTSSPASLDSSFIQDFYQSNNISRGSVWKINQFGNNYSMQFLPSNATPVLTKLEGVLGENTGNDFYFISQDGTVIVPGSPYLSEWIGISSTLPFQSSVCSNLQGAPLTHYTGDVLYSSGFGECNEVSRLNPNATYGLFFTNTGDGTVYYETAFYTPITHDYLIQPACTNSALYFAPTGSFFSSTNPAGIPLNHSEKQFGSLNSIKEYLTLVEQEYMCITSDQNTLDLWWNPRQLHSDLMTALNPSALSDFQACPNVYVN